MHKRRQFLKEDVALTKGSQRIMANKALVKSLAETVRDDSDFHPQAFPAGFAKKFQKSTDESVAQWFLESIDNIERAGYDGVVYSRDGANSMWIVNSYIKNKSTWEDIHGNLNMILRDWYWLKNRNLLKPEHRELTAFEGVNRMSQVIMSTYADALADYRENAKKNAATLALKKSAKSVKILDNDDYRIQVPFNKPASVLMADGAKWCTANLSDAMKSYWHTYSGRAMIFIMVPFTKDEETGKKSLIGKDVTVTDGPKRGAVISTYEKFQFDSGSGDFMDIGNVPVRPPTVIAERFPYLYDDIATALHTHAAEMESNWERWDEDNALNDNPETKPKKYDVNEEIKKLDIFVQKGYFTTEKRPAVAPAPAAQEPVAPVEQPEQGQQMESLKSLANIMLAEHGLTSDELDEHTDIDEEDMEQDGGLDSMPAANGAKGGSGNLAPTMPESINKGNRIMENVDKDVAAMLTSLKKYDKLTESVLGMTTVGMARNVAEDTSQQRGQTNDDKHAEDAFSANRAKKRNDADEEWAKSKGKVDEAEEVEEDEIEESGKPWEKDEDKEEVDESEEIDEVVRVGMAPNNGGTASGGDNGKNLKTPHPGDRETRNKLATQVKANRAERSANPHNPIKSGAMSAAEPGAWDKDRGVAASHIKESQVDPEILDWMNRFSKLGNMKGYGR